MKIIFSLLFLSVFTVSTKAQIDETLKNMRLYEGSVYVTYGHRITEIFSELRFELGVGVFPKTNIAYLTYNQLILLMQDSAKRQGWEQNRYVESRNSIRNNAEGGRIILYIERFDQYLTNNKFLFIIVRDTLEQKIFEYNLPYRPADLVTTELFSNWAYIDINVPLPDTFFVYVNHKLTEFLSDTKFLIQTNTAPIVQPAHKSK